MNEQEKSGSRSYCLNQGEIKKTEAKKRKELRKKSAEVQAKLDV